jgi:hypothetical protein
MLVMPYVHWFIRKTEKGNCQTSRVKFRMIYAVQISMLAAIKSLLYERLDIVQE